MDAVEDAIEDAIAALQAARPDLAPPDGRAAHKLFIWYRGEQDPEVFDIPARCWLWEQVDEPRVVERIELYEAQEYGECAALHAVDGHRHEDRWGIGGRPEVP